jgi:hypothetical protein
MEPLERAARYFEKTEWPRWRLLYSLLDALEEIDNAD